MNEVNPEADCRWRGEPHVSVYEIDMWFPRGFTEKKLINWCDENCIGPYIVCHPPGATVKGVNNKQKYSFKNLDISCRMHIKLVNETDIVLFKLTWV